VAYLYTSYFLWISIIDLQNVTNVLDIKWIFEMSNTYLIDKLCYVSFKYKSVSYYFENIKNIENIIKLFWHYFTCHLKINFFIKKCFNVSSVKILPLNLIIDQADKWLKLCFGDLRVTYCNGCVKFEFNNI